MASSASNHIPQNKPFFAFEMSSYRIVKEIFNNRGSRCFSRTMEMVLMMRVSRRSLSKNNSAVDEKTSHYASAPECGECYRNTV